MNLPRYFTDEQRAQLEERGRELGDAGIAAAEREWAELIAAVETERAHGTDPSDPRVRALADRWMGLVERFTGGDPGIRSSLQRMYSEQGPARASRGTVTPELMGCVAAARGR